MTFTALRDIEVGEEITIYYGDPPLVGSSSSWVSKQQPLGLTRMEILEALLFDDSFAAKAFSSANPVACSGHRAVQAPKLFREFLSGSADAGEVWCDWTLTKRQSAPT